MSSAESGKKLRVGLFKLIDDEDDRVAYNALWIISHFNEAHHQWLLSKRCKLLNQLLHEAHPGKRRLLLSVLKNIPITKKNLHIDYLNYCLDKINSMEPYAIRAWAMKQAFEMCRYYPDLVEELRLRLAILENGELSPGILSAKRQIESKLTRLRN